MLTIPRNTLKLPANSAFLLALVFLSVLVRSYRLDFAGYWIDEMSSIHFATNAHWGAIFWDNSPGLYNALLKIWIYFFGDSEAATRALSVMFSAMTTLLWGKVGLSKHGWRGGLLLGLTHILYNQSIFFARETRMYAMFELVCTLLFIGVHKLIDGEEISRWKIWTVLILSMLTHYLAVLPIGIALLALIAFRPQIFRSRYLKDFIFIAIMAVALLFLVRWQSLDWQKFKFALDEESRWPWRLARQIAGGWVGLLALTFWAAVGIVRNQRHSYLLIIAACLALASYGAVGLYLGRSFFLPRYFIYLVPLVMFSFVDAFDLLRARVEWLDRFRLAALVLFLGAQIHAYSQDLQREKPPWHQAALRLWQEFDPFVLTTRPLSLSSPYFDRYHIQIHKFSPNDQNQVADMFARAKADQNVWILEGFWGASGYMARLEAHAGTQGCHFEDHSLRNSNPEWVILKHLVCE